MRQPLTKPQGDLYHWICDYIQRHEYSPSIREMVEAMNLHSPAPIQARLKHLRQKGWIEWDDGKARTIRIVQGDRPMPEEQLRDRLSALESRLEQIEKGAIA